MCKVCAMFLFWYMNTQLFPHHLLKRLSFFITSILLLYQRSVYRFLWVYFRAVYTVQLNFVPFLLLIPYCLDYSGFIVNVGIRECASSIELFFCIIVLALLGHLSFHIKSKSIHQYFPVDWG
jgi:hypothetical protein